MIRQTDQELKVLERFSKQKHSLTLYLQSLSYIRSAVQSCYFTLNCQLYLTLKRLFWVYNYRHANRQ